MRKYGLEICRQWYRESAANIGFEKVRRLMRQRIYVLFWRSNAALRCLLLFASFSFLSVFMNCAPLFRARLFNTDNNHASSLFPSALGVNCVLLQILRKSSLSRDGHRRSRWPNVCCRLGRHLRRSCSLLTLRMLRADNVVALQAAVANVLSHEEGVVVLIKQPRLQVAAGT
jgi:hypothetical protein